MADANLKEGPCAGIKVLEIASMVAGPLAGQMLGDLGADVIKIEAPGGDTLRMPRPQHKGIGAIFTAMNRHKRSIVLDLKSEFGRETARKLAMSADVLLENSRPGVMERLGLGYEELRKDNPGLIYVSVSGFGPDGPYAGRPAFDQIIQAMTGVMKLQNKRGDPEPIRNAMVDKYTASAAASATLAALLHRERSSDGQGQKVSVSLLGAFSSIALLDNILDDVFADGDETLPDINVFVPIRTADGSMMGHIQTDEQFARLCRMLGREELITDQRFATGWDRLSRIEEMWREIEKSTVKMQTDDLVEAVEQAGVTLGRVNSVTEFMADPHVKHNELVVEYEDPEFGPIRHLNYPARFDRTPASVRARAPKLGEHSDTILKELGLDEDAIAAAREAGSVR